MRNIAKLIDAKKVYKAGDTMVTALDRTTLDVDTGKLMLVIGPSGSGKTTLLSLLGCVIYPTEGKVVIDGVDTSRLGDRALANLRLQNIGFVFQSFNLVAPLTAEENVSFPLKLMGRFSGREIRDRAQAALEFVGLSDKRRSLPRQLSGGQQQRVAIARALVTEPAMLLCDEPTAALDVRSLERVMEELRELADRDRAVVVVTHDHRLERYADQVIEVENGRVMVR